MKREITTNPITRRRWLRAAAGLTGTFATSKAQTRPPNVIFILADDMGWGDPACYGNRFIQTPNLDRLAKHGTLFTQFYSNNPVCSPSRTAWMTGQFPARHLIHGHLATPELNEKRAMPNFLDPKVVMLPRLLHSAGYATGHVGKWHLGHGPGAPTAEAYGIDFVRTVVSNQPYWQYTEKDMALFMPRSTRLFVDESLAFIEKHRQQPFFLNLWTLLPHAPLNPTKEQMAPYERFAPGLGVPDRSARQIYYASVTDVDTQIGRILGKLDDLGLTDNTIVVFSSDNGPEDIHISNAGHSGVGSPGPLRGRKRSLYEGGVRMPYIVRWPGQIPAARVDNESVISAVDFLPTICAAVGMQPPRSWALDGESVISNWRGQSRPRTKPILWEWRYEIFGYHVNRSPMLAIRDGRWKLLMNPDHSRVELYDIPLDPAEMTNLAEKHPDVVRRLSEPLMAWHRALPPGPSDAVAGRNDYPWPK